MAYTKKCQLTNENALIKVHLHNLQCNVTIDKLPYFTIYCPNLKKNVF